MSLSKAFSATDAPPKPFRPFRVRKFGLGEEIHADRDEMYSERKVKGDRPGVDYSMINKQKLADLLGISDCENDLRAAHESWVEEKIKRGLPYRDSAWTESVAVGGKEFLERVKFKFGAKAIGRKIVTNKNNFEIREEQEPYDAVLGAEKAFLSSKNMYFGDVYPKNTI